MCVCDTHPEGTLVPLMQADGYEWHPSKVRTRGWGGQKRSEERKRLLLVVQGRVSLGALGVWLVHRWV